MKTKAIIGYDIGVNSIGHSYIIETTDDDDNFITTLPVSGVYIPNINSNKEKEFEKGSGSGSLNIDRRKLRSARVQNKRRKSRIKQLKTFLKEINILPKYQNVSEYFTQKELDIIIPTNINNTLQYNLYLRNKAINEKLTEPELGLVILFMNKRRGFTFDVEIPDQDTKEKKKENKSNKDIYKDDAIEMKKALISNTIGEYHFNKLTQLSEHEKNHYTIRGKRVERDAYKKEFDLIFTKQKEFHPNLFTDSNIKKLRKIIYTQRPLKSQKKLVSIDENTKSLKIINDYISVRQSKNKNPKKSTKEVIIGSKVCNETNPFFELYRIYSKVNDIRVYRTGDDNKTSLTPYEKKLLIDKLLIINKITFNEINKVFKTSNIIEFDDSIKHHGLKGFTFVHKIKTILEDCDNEIVEKLLEYDLTSLNAKGELPWYIIKSNIYKLWHILYSIPIIDNDSKQLKIKTLINQFGISEDIAELLLLVDLKSDKEFTELSLNTIKKILPKVIQGKCYSDACEEVDIKNKGSLTKEEKQNRNLKTELSLINKGYLRNPIVEKMVNAMIVINNKLLKNITEVYEDIEIQYKLETARDLTKSKKVRKEIFKKQIKGKNINNDIKNKIIKLKGSATKKEIEKYKLWLETDGIFLYTGDKINECDIFNYEFEHIIPKSDSYDNHMDNLTLCPEKLNKEKNKRTAYDYVKSKGEDKLKQYIKLIEKLNKEGKLNDTKFTNLKLKGTELTKHFTEKDKTQFGYITNKCVEILNDCSNDITRISGRVTAYLRKEIWNYDDILFQLIKEKDNQYDLINYNKHDDYRNHQLDAIIINYIPSEITKYFSAHGKKKGNLINKYIKELSTMIKVDTNTQHYINENNETIKYYNDDDLIKQYFKRKFPKPISNIELINLLNNTLVRFNNNKQKRGQLHCETSMRKCDEENVFSSRTKISGLTDNMIYDEKNSNNSAVKKIKEYIKFYNLNEKIKTFKDIIYIDTIFDFEKNEIKKGVIPIKSVNIKKIINSPIKINAFDGNKNYIKYYENSKNFNAIVYKNIDGGKKLLTVKVNNLFDKLNKSNEIPLNTEFLFNMKINDYFYINNDEENISHNDFLSIIKYAEQNKDNNVLSKYLFKVKSISMDDYKFIHHTEARSKINTNNKKIYIRISSDKNLINIIPTKPFKQ